MLSFERDAPRSLFAVPFPLVYLRPPCIRPVVRARLRLYCDRVHLSRRLIQAPVRALRTILAHASRLIKHVPCQRSSRFALTFGPTSLHTGPRPSTL